MEWRQMGKSWLQNLLRRQPEPHWVWWRLWSFDFNQGLGALLGSVEPPFELGGREVVEVAV